MSVYDWPDVIDHHQYSYDFGDIFLQNLIEGLYILCGSVETDDNKIDDSKIDIFPKF